MIGEVGYSTALLAGSAAYMAPELFPRGEVNIDELFSKESDIYAFGMVCVMVSLIPGEKSFSRDIFQIFTGEAPFAYYKAHLDWQIVPLVQQGQRPLPTSEPARRIPANIWRLMEACWATARKDRPSAEEIVRQLR